MQTYELGTTTIDITPPMGTFLSGYSSRTKPSTSVYHPLRAVVSVLSDGRTRACLVSAEWLGFYDRAEEARVRIAEATGIDAGHTFLFGTHTHYGPSVRRDIDTRRKCFVDEEYVSRTLEAISKAAVTALESMRPCNSAEAEDGADSRPRDGCRTAVVLSHGLPLWMHLTIMKFQSSWRRVNRGS